MRYSDSAGDIAGRAWKCQFGALIRVEERGVVSGHRGVAIDVPTASEIETIR